MVGPSREHGTVPACVFSNRKGLHKDHYGTFVGCGGVATPGGESYPSQAVRRARVDDVLIWDTALSTALGP